MKYANLPLLQICTVFFLGVWFGFIDLELDYAVYVLLSLSLFILLIISFFIYRGFRGSKMVSTVICLLLIFSLGVLNTNTHLPEHQKNHFSRFLSQDSLGTKYVSFEGEVVKPLKPGAFKDKYQVSLSTLEGSTVYGKVLFQTPVSDELSIRSNSKITGYGTIKAFEDPQNPQQFNYKDYMATQAMSHVIDSQASQIVIEDKSRFSFYSLGEHARTKIQESLKKHAFTKEQMGIIQALVLGQKQEIDPETYDQFSKAGVVHILAVSGLHVGIVLLILQFITKRFLRIRYGKVIQNGVVLLGIWGFATLAGFTPSVLRAAVMFSFLSFALGSKRKTSAINTLALSAVFLIIINPYFIYQVGFQLSYLAVISIVTLQPRLSRLYSPKYYLDRKIWDIITVTLSAQLGVLPLSLYYFHQFPGLFLVSNLLILPGLGLLLGGGILIILLSLLDLLPEFFVTAYGHLLDLLLSFVNWIATKEDLVFSNIYFTRPMLIASLFLLFCLILWDYKRKLRSYILLNFSLILLFVIVHLEKRAQLQQEELVIFQTFRNSHLGELKGSFLKLYSDKLQPKDSIEGTYHIKNYKNLKGIKTIQISGFRNIYELHSSKFLIAIDSIPVYPDTSFRPEYILLKNSPDINLDRLITELKPKQIIADGSNYKSDIKRWQASAKRFGTKFHSTWEDGAFVFTKN